MDDDVSERNVSRIVPVPPTRLEHPVVQRDADDAVAPDDGADLVIGKLPLMRDERPAVGVARHDAAGVMRERIPEGLVRAVAEIEHDPQPLHLRE
jgi:hypothetical protein